MGKGKVNLKPVFRDYMAGKIKLEKYQKLGILFLIVVFSGFFGWVYEFIFYYFDGGTGDFYMQGGNLRLWCRAYSF